jgi:hypothetical protein
MYMFNADDELRTEQNGCKYKLLTERCCFHNVMFMVYLILHNINNELINIGRNDSQKFRLGTSACTGNNNK